jgi:hypothetical protein
MVNTKIVDNLSIYLVLKLHGNRLNGLRVMAVGSWPYEVLTLWIFWIDLGNCLV